MSHRSNQFLGGRARTLASTFLLGCVTLLLPVSEAAAGTPPDSAAAVTFEERMLELINGARKAAGAAPLQASATLAGVARDAPYHGCGYPVAGRSADMGARNYFSHTIRDCGNQTASDMLRAAGVTSSSAENIAWVSAITDPLVAAERLHNDLMASPPHRTNILNVTFTHVGVGSWHTEPGQNWSGGGYPLRNVYVTTEIFSRMPAASAAGARYHAVTPSRILDTRMSGTPLGAAATMDLQVTGQGGIPATGVSAVVVNVTVTNPTAPSYLTVFPSGESMPLAANLNYVAGNTVPNLVTAKLGTGGRLSIYNAAGSTDVIADVAGWYDDGTLSSGARFHPVTPSRILDTRAAVALGPAGTMDVQLAGMGGIPVSGVSAVVINVTVTGPTATSYLTAFPAGEARPLAANLNYTAGQTVPNLVTAKLGSGGRVSMYNAAGTTEVVIDVAGWYDDGTTTTGATFHPVTPSRILDTRIGAPVDAATALEVQVSGRGGVPATGVSAVVMNVTVTDPTAASYLTAFPTGEAMPWAANLNYVPGQTVPNLVAAKLGAGGRVSMANAAGSTHVIADVAGWFDAG